MIIVIMCNVLHLERLVGVDDDLTLLLVRPRDHQHVVQAAQVDNVTLLHR